MLHEILSTEAVWLYQILGAEVVICFTGRHWYPDELEVVVYLVAPYPPLDSVNR